MRIATVSYLNAKPLTSYLDRALAEVVEGHPAEIADLLAAGEADVALVPVAAVLCQPDLRVLGEHCIGSEGPVHSVLLVSEQPPEGWTEVVLDGVSRTSVTLARLLLTRGPLAGRVRADLRIRDGAMGEGLASAQGTVAGLVIGDAARSLPGRLAHRVDLAEEWTRWTGLPFVFAVWAGRADLPAAVRAELLRAGRLGLERRDSDHAAADLTYVTEHIRYTFDDKALVGLRRYAALAHEEGLVSESQVLFYDPPRRSLPRRDVETLLLRAAEGGHLDRPALLAILRDAPLTDLAAAARERARSSWMEAEVGWTPARRILVTDVDLVGAEGWRAPGERGAILLTPSEVAGQTAEAVEIEAGEVHLVGGRHPGLGLEGWCGLIREVAELGPAVRAVDLDYLAFLAEREGLSFEEVVARLRAAGLAGLAEAAVLSVAGAVRPVVAPHKMEGEAWLQAATMAARVGLPLVAGLELGAGETDADRLDHLLALRALQAQTGAFRAFRVETLREERRLAPQGATAQDLVRWVALARLVLDEISVHEASWLHRAPGLAQASLHAGATDLGPVILPARVGQHDNPYINPRAVVGARREVDPWAIFCAEVDYHLTRAGFISRRSRVPGVRSGIGPQTPDLQPSI